VAPSKKPYSFLIDPELDAGLKRVKARDGIPEAEQIRRALAAWLEIRESTAHPSTRSRARKRST
jgi:hypothetical protein